MIRGIIYLTGLCTLGVIMVVGAVILWLSNVPWGEYADRGKELAKARIEETVRSALDEAVEPAREESAVRIARAPDEETRRVEPPAPAEKGPAWNHLVKKGETLYSIALTYYSDGKRWREIARENGIESPSDLRAGTTLEIPR